MSKRPDFVAPTGWHPPTVLSISVEPRREEVAGGVPMSNRRIENYVLLSALPEELRRRVVTAIETAAAQF